ncbi:hypothetical protein F2P79_018292 [Pimephales promelas]|nr:hypothetical protein F2P79_018292 [Pimephales promelas]
MELNSLSAVDLEVRGQMSQIEPTPPPAAPPLPLPIKGLGVLGYTSIILSDRQCIKPGFVQNTFRFPNGGVQGGFRAGATVARSLLAAPSSYQTTTVCCMPACPAFSVQFDLCPLNCDPMLDKAAEGPDEYGSLSVGHYNVMSTDKWCLTWENQSILSFRKTTNAPSAPPVLSCAIELSDDGAVPSQGDPACHSVLWLTAMFARAAVAMGLEWNLPPCPSAHS